MLMMPYFLKDERWYVESFVEDEEFGRYVVYELTDEAPIEAIRAYNEYYAPYLIEEDEDGNVIAVLKRLKDGTYEQTIDGEKTIVYI